MNAPERVMLFGIGLLSLVAAVPEGTWGMFWVAAAGTVMFVLGGISAAVVAER